MTEKEFKRKYDEITDWCIKELDKIAEEIHKENKYVGLDGNQEKYQPVYNKYKTKINNLIKEFKQ